MPVTYRHLLSPQSTSHNPLRVIAHCDIDAAYAQFEQVRLGLPDDLPLICAQWQSIIAVNYPARKYGVKRFNTIEDAKKMCPGLYVQHVATYRNGESEAGYWDEVDSRTHKVSLDPYRRESLKILAVFKEMVTKGEIASIDEAFLDLTQMAAERLLARHPHLASETALDTPLPPPPPIEWTGNVIPIPTEDHTDTWEDWALFYGAEIMAEVRAEVFSRLQYTCSAGIAHGKAFAKLCSAWKKPNNQTVLRAAATADFLRDMDFTDIRFLGGKLGTAIAIEYNAKTVGDLLTVPLDEMQKRFGEEAVWVYNVIRGIDNTDVTPRLATKSMLASKNTRPAVTTPEQGLHWLRILAGELYVRLREAREVTPGIWPRTLVLGHRTGIESAKHRQVPFPFSRNLSAEYIVKYAQKLWEEVCQPMSRGGMKLNNMSLSFSGLERMEEGQQGIEGFFGAASAASKASTSVGAAHTTSTSGAVSNSNTAAPTPSGASAPAAPAAKAKTRLPPLRAEKRKPLDGFLVKNGESSRPAQSGGPSRNTSASPAPRALPSATIRADDVIVLDDEDEDDVDEGNEGGEGPRSETPAHTPRHTDNDQQSAWTCPKCGATIPETCTSAADAEDSPSLPPEQVRAQRQEHEDWHFALELQNGPSPKRAKTTGGTGTGASGSGGVVGGVKSKGNGAKAKDKTGIKAFFAPKPRAAQ